MPALPSFMDHMQLNPRSVLRPEYLNYSRVHSSTSDHFVAPSFEKRLNTNTAPLYTTENRSFRRKYLRDAIHHPYSRSNCRSHESSPQNGATLRNSSSLRCGPLAVPLRSGYSSPDSDGPSRIYPSPSLTYTPKFASDLRNTRSESDVLVRDVEENAVSSRSHSHGQSEQLRRSRESNTFALIDAQLSCLPLSQVRDMYLQSRSGANFSGSSAARTTKKVNLSVVHTIVRFRLKEYLSDIQDHTNFLLDTLLSSTFEDYHPGMRNELASKLFGISRLPCAADCQFCPGLLSRQTRSRRRNRLNERCTTDKVPLIVSPCPLDSSVRPFSSSSSNNSTTPMLTASDAPSESHDFSPSSNLKDDIDQDLNKIERKSFSEEDKATPVDILDDLNNIKLTPGYSNAFGSLDRSRLLNLPSENVVRPTVCDLLRDYFTDRTHSSKLNGKNPLSSVRSGVLQGAILLPFLFPLCSYADDVLGCISPTNLDSASLHRRFEDLVEWSLSRSLTLNTFKYNDVIFSFLRGNKLQSLIAFSPTLTVNENPLPSSSTVRYLGAFCPRTFLCPRNSVQLQKVGKLSFYPLRLEMFSVPRTLVFNYVTSCIIPHWLYCSPVIFPGQLQKGFTLLVRSIKHISRYSGLCRDSLVDLLISRHLDACNDFFQCTD